MAITRIKNNQITDATILANAKVVDYSVTASKLANNIVYGSDLTVSGNLTVNGQTTTVDTISVVIEDPILLLAKDQTGSPAVDIGYIGERGTSQNIAFVWDESASEFVTVYTNDTITNTTVTISSYANFHTNDANIGGNIVINGTTSFVGNIIGTVGFSGNLSAGNILTPGLVSATGNITGGNVNTAGLVSATGNVQGGNINTAGLVSATGNVQGGNINTAGLVSATGNIISAANVTGGNLTTAGLITATGNIQGGNLNTGGLVSATGNIISAANVSGGNILTGGIMSSTGNGIHGNVLTDGLVSATGNVTGGNVNTGGLITATGNIISAANVTGGNLTTAGLVTATGNIISAANVTGGNLTTAGLITATGNIQGGNLNTGGLISATGNIISAANVSGGNIVTGGLVSATGNIIGGNLISGNAVIGNIDVSGNITVNSLSSNTFVSAGGNVIGGNVNTAGLVSATGNVTGGNVNTAGLVSATGNVISAANVTGGNLTTAGLVTATGNITGGNINTAGIVSSTGNVIGGNVLTSGLVSATGNITSSANVSGGNLITGGLISATGNINGSNLNITGGIFDTTALTITTASGDITLNAAGNINADNNYINNVTDPVQNQDAATKNYVDQLVASGLTYHEAVVAATTTTLATTTGGTVTYNQPNGAGNGVGATLTTTGAFNLIDSANVQTLGTRILVKNEANAVHNGVYVWSNATVITRSVDADEYGLNSAQAISLNSYFFVSGGNVNLGSAYVVDEPTGSITFGTSNIEFAQFSQAQIYSANTSAGINLVGQTFSAKVDNNTTAFDGGGNIIVKAGANLTTPNIGAATGTSLSVTGNVTGGNVNTAGLVSATGNVVGGNVNTVGLITATGNIQGGNLNTAGLVSATGNIISTANVTGGNILTSGIMSSTGNAIHGNILTGGLVSATGNITSAANVSGGNLVTGGLVSSTGNIISAANVSGDNILTGGLVSATGNVISAANVTGGNLTTAGLVTATGNVTGGNVNTAGLVSATGNVISAANISGGNILTGGIMSSTGNVTGGNIITGGFVTATGNIATALYFLGDGGLLSNVSAAVSVNKIVNGASYANIASSGGNLDIVINNSTIETITNAGVLNTGFMSAVGNVTGGNVNTAGLVSATGNIQGGNVNTAGLVSATGNVISAANISGGNLVTGGLVSATGNIISAANVSGGNIVTGGLISATGNITGGNITTAGQANIGNIRISGDNITDTNGRVNFNTALADVDFAVNGTAANVFFVDAGSNAVAIGNSTVISGAALAIQTKDSMRLPTGATGDRPGTAVVGMLRFNTSINNLEFYDGNSWQTAGTQFTVIASQTFNGDGSTVAFTLSDAQTTASCIVSINGVVQIPSTAYSVSGTTLTFTEAPLSGDVIEVRKITTTTTVSSLSNGPGNAVISMLDTTNDISITGDLIPTANVTFDLGNSTNRWRDGYFSGTSLTLGNVVMKNVAGGNTIGFFGPDGTTPATIASTSVDTTTIANGTSNVTVAGSGGNVRVNVGATSNVAVFDSTGLAITGNLSVTGNATLSGNILGDRVQNGTTSFDIQTVNGNANISVAGTSNVAVFATTGALITGVMSASGNVTGGNVNTAGLVSATGNIIGSYILGNGSQLTGIDATSIQNGTANVRTFLNGNVAVSAAGTANVVVITSTGQLTTGIISASGNITGGNLSVGTGTVNLGNIVNTNANGVGNIGSSSLYFNTVFAKATSAQYADLAEKYEADAEYLPGTVLCFGGDKEVTLGNEQNKRRVAGVVSTNPSYIMNSGLEGAHVVTVALTGRVPTRVTGSVRKGDMLVATDNGFAKADENPLVGTVIGKALEDFDGQDGVIEVVVGRV